MEYKVSIEYGQLESPTHEHTHTPIQTRPQNSIRYTVPACQIYDLTQPETCQKFIAMVLGSMTVTFYERPRHRYTTGEIHNL